MQRTSYNGAPLVNFLQTRDLSVRVVNVPEERLAQFIAKFFILSEEGVTDPILAVGEQLDLAFGAETFDITSKYFTHQTKYALRACKTGMTMLQRIVPDDSKKASTTIYAVVKTTTRDIYERNSDGSIAIPNVVADNVQGAHIIFASKEGMNDSIINIDADTTAYPIIQMEASAEGERYNDIGIGVSSLTEFEVGAKYKTENGYLPFKLSLYDKKSSKAKRIITTLASDGVTGTFYDKRRDPYTKAISSIIRNFKNQYFNTADVKRPYKMDLVGNFNILENNIITVNQIIADLENSLVNEDIVTFSDGKTGTTVSWFDYPDADTSKYSNLINMFTCKSTSGVPYMACSIDSAGVEINLGTEFISGVNFGNNSPIFMEGGDDGTITPTIFNDLVLRKLTEYNDQFSPLLDMLYNVESTFVDTGFPLDVKLNGFPNVLLHRPDTNIIFSTVDMMIDADREQSIEEMKNVADAIMTKIRPLAESVYYNTGVMRAIIVGGNGDLADGSVFERYSQNYALFGMFSDYMGAGNAEWQPTKRFDIASGNVISDMVRMSPAHIPTVIRGVLTDSQLVYTTRYNRTLYQFPAVQTVYEEDNSVLNSALTMFGICYLTKVGVRAHREFTGSQRMTKEQIADSVVSFVNKAVAGKFDDSFVIVPIVTFLNDGPVYEWNLDIQITGAYMMTVETLTITANSYN